MNRQPEYVGKSAYRGEVVTHYDRDRENEEIWAREQAFVAQWSSETVRPHERVLDLPTGTGRFLKVLLAAGAHVVAADISADMLAQVQARMAAAQEGVLELRQADAEHLPFRDGEFDHVLSWRFLHLLPPSVVSSVLKEFRRVCRRTVVVQIFQVRRTGFQRSLLAWTKDRLRPLWRRLRLPTRAPASPWAHITSYVHDEPALLGAFASAGLHVVRVHTLETDALGFVNRVYFLEPAGTGPGSV